MNIFNGMFGPIKEGMCRIGVNGKVAIKTSSGYKAYDVSTGRLTNCNGFAFDVGEDMFFVIPTNKVAKGDIILASGIPKCVIEAGKNEIKAFCYETGTIETIVPERHVFMGKQYFYGKIVSIFGNAISGGKGGMNNMFRYMMVSQMMKNAGSTWHTGSGDSGNMFGGNNMLPMMMLMNGGGGMFDGMFDGVLDLDDADDAEDTDKEEGDE